MRESLHFAPGNHGSHGSPKRSVSYASGHFCLRIQFLLGLLPFVEVYQGIHDRPWVEMLDGALRFGPQSVTDECMIPSSLQRSGGTSHGLSFRIKFCHVYQILPRFARVKHGE